MEVTADGILYEVKVDEEIHTIFKAPHELPGGEKRLNASAFNVVMVDVSGSMSCYWHNIQTYWNELISPALLGTTRTFTFGSEVSFRRNCAVLQSSDFDASCTELTGAIDRIGEEIKSAKSEFIRVFLVTDGHHNASERQPDEAISQLSIPKGKTIEVFLLGLGSSFPVEYSISIRSVLHNGNTNLPSLFWAQETEDIETEIKNIEEILKIGFVELQVSVPGYLCPGLPPKQKVHLGEFLYYPYPPDNLMEAIKLTIEDDEGGKRDVRMNLEKKEIDFRLLLDSVFRQWNSIVIQHHRNKETVPMEAFDVMNKIYGVQKVSLEETLEKFGNSNKIESRLAKKKVKSLEVEYATLMNQSKTVIGLEGQYESEIQMADVILKTTVKSKYDTKNLKMKGRGSDDYEEDMRDFKEIYLKNKDAIMSLPDPPPEECCNVTFGAVVKDLQDPSFFDLMAEDKFTFMKTFCLTGIPIYAPVKDASQINPWTMKIKKILSTPYNLISQCTLELSAEAGSEFGAIEDKDVYLQEGDEDSRLNAIVPVFSPTVAEVLKPLVRTNIFAMVTTFCILKNPHIVDMNAHMAALGCVFVKTVTDFPHENRPEYIKERIKLIEATAKLYVDRKGFAKYLDILLQRPAEALMTESKEEVEGSTIKCESLIKPCFFLYLARDQITDKQQLKHFIELLCLEFIGRCLSKYSESTPYLDYFVSELSSKEKKDQWMEVKIKDEMETVDKFIVERGDLLRTYFKPEELIASLKVFCNEHFKLLMNSDSMYSVEVIMKKVKKLYSLSSAGDLSWKGLKQFATEMLLPDEEIEEVFSQQAVFTYVYHGLQFRNSKDRLSQSVPSYDSCLDSVRRLTNKENGNGLKKMATQMILQEAQERWYREFMEAHKPIAQPMTKKDIIERASALGIEVDISNFKTVYRYNSQTKLVRNACMVETCPHFLKPNRTFNQHISVERQKQQGFPHRLHRVSFDTASCSGSSADVIESLLIGHPGSLAGRKTTGLPSAEILATYKEAIQQLIDQYRHLIGSGA